MVLGMAMTIKRILVGPVWPFCRHFPFFSNTPASKNFALPKASSTDLVAARPEIITHRLTVFRRFPFVHSRFERSFCRAVLTFEPSSSNLMDIKWSRTRPLVFIAVVRYSEPVSLRT